MSTPPSPFDAFVLSLDADDAPPAATPMLRAIRYGLRGEWQAAHELAQSQADANGAWVHAWLHRIEGDLANADYWYRRAHRPPRRDDTRTEGLAIARELIEAIGHARDLSPCIGRRFNMPPMGAPVPANSRQRRQAALRLSSNTCRPKPVRL
jgi:hypothetical protein